MSEDRNQERIQDLLIDYGFDNEIDVDNCNEEEVKKEKTPRLRYTSLSPLEAVEQEKLRKKNEAEFRSWLIKNKPESSVLTAIETNTATGVPDLYGCYCGHSFWFECKSLIVPRPSYIRGTQYVFMKKLIEAGGNAKVVTQYFSTQTNKLASIHLFNAKNIVCHPIEFFTTYRSSERLHFPRTLKPDYIWYYDKQDKEDLNYFYQRLFLDSDDFIW